MLTGLQGIKTLKDFDLKDKVVFLRLDLNVPLKDSQVSDDTRINACLPTINYCREQGAKLVLASHLGRPKDGGAEDRQKYSLEPVAKKMGEILQCEVLLVEDPGSDAPKALLSGLKRNQILLLENLRFDPREKKNDSSFSAVLASYSDVYINDAFGSSHRAHSSTAGLPELMKEKGIGFLIEKEVSMLSQLLSSPESPYTAVLGGVKVSDKIDVIENLIDRVDSFIIGGAMSYTFLKAQGIAVGSSLVETDKLSFAREMMKRLEARDKTILLPVDHIVTNNLNKGEVHITDDEKIEEGWMGVDIGPKTISRFQEALKLSRTVFWNGPMGIFENPEFSKGTFAIAESIAPLHNEGGLTIIGGGDSAAAASASGLASKMSHISTGGGASLEFLQGKNLPGIESVRRRR